MSEMKEYRVEYRRSIEGVEFEDSMVVQAFSNLDARTAARSIYADAYILWVERIPVPVNGDDALPLR